MLLIFIVMYNHDSQFPTL